MTMADAPTVALHASTPTVSPMMVPAVMTGVPGLTSSGRDLSTAPRGHLGIAIG